MTATPAGRPKVLSVAMRVWLSVALWTVGLSAAAGPDSGDNAQAWAVHGQFTYVEQETSGFNAPYAGRNSLSPNRGAETTDATLYLVLRFCPPGEGWLDTSIDEGLS